MNCTSIDKAESLVILYQGHFTVVLKSDQSSWLRSPAWKDWMDASKLDVT